MRTPSARSAVSKTDTLLHQDPSCPLAREVVEDNLVSAGAGSSCLCTGARGEEIDVYSMVGEKLANDFSYVKAAELLASQVRVRAGKSGMSEPAALAPMFQELTAGRQEAGRVLRVVNEIVGSHYLYYDSGLHLAVKAAFLELIPDAPRIHMGGGDELLRTPLSEHGVFEAWRKGAGLEDKVSLLEPLDPDYKNLGARKAVRAAAWKDLDLDILHAQLRILNHAIDVGLSLEDSRGDVVVYMKNWKQDTNRNVRSLAIVVGERHYVGDDLALRVPRWVSEGLRDLFKEERLPSDSYLQSFLLGEAVENWRAMCEVARGLAEAGSETDMYQAWHLAGLALAEKA